MPGRIWIGSRVMSTPAKSRPMLTISRNASSVRRRGTLVMSSATVPSGKPRPSLISVCSARERRRVVLDHLHVHQLGPDSVRLGDPVPGDDQAVGGRLVDLARAA